jgi:hypothetical protein
MERARAFHLNPIDSDLMTCPGISAKSKRLLVSAGVSTTDQLVGHYFLTNRDQVQFTHFLANCGMKWHGAMECAHQVAGKYGPE